MAKHSPLTPQAIAFIKALAVAAARIDHERDLEERRKRGKEAA